MKRVLRSKTDYRSTILRNLLTSLILFEAVSTTQPQAKELISYANHFFNKVRSKTLAAQKLAHQTLTHKNAIKKLFEELLGRYPEGETTFVTSLRLLPRRGDNAPMMMVKILRELKVEPKKPATKKATAKKADG